MTMELKILSSPVNETELIQQVGGWADRNFERLRWPEIGVAEEIGEAMHCVLKRRQKIRGFEKNEIFFPEFIDALADTIIYLCDWCHMHHAFFKLGRNQMPPQKADERKIMTHLLQAAGSLMNLDEMFHGDPAQVGEQQIYNNMAQRVCLGIEYWAHLYDIDLPLSIASTWASVSKRDWKKNSVEGK